MDRHPLVVEWLSANGFTLDGTVAADLAWCDRQDRRTPRQEIDIILRPDGQSFVTAIVETAEVSSGESTSPFFVKRSYYRVLPGARATVCPQASPQIAIQQAERLATHLRNDQRIDQSETIHWIGSVRGIEHNCCCELTALGDQVSFPTTPANSANPGGKPEKTKRKRGDPVPPGEQRRDAELLDARNRAWKAPACDISQAEFAAESGISMEELELRLNRERKRRARKRKSD